MKKLGLIVFLIGFSVAQEGLNSSLEHDIDVIMKESIEKMLIYRAFSAHYAQSYAERVLEEFHKQIKYMHPEYAFLIGVGLTQVFTFCNCNIVHFGKDFGEIYFYKKYTHMDFLIYLIILASPRKSISNCTAKNCDLFDKEYETNFTQTTFKTLWRRKFPLIYNETKEFASQFVPTRPYVSTNLALLASRGNIGLGFATGHDFSDTKMSLFTRGFNDHNLEHHYIFLAYEFNPFQNHFIYQIRRITLKDIKQYYIFQMYSYSNVFAIFYNNHYIGQQQ